MTKCQFCGKVDDDLRDGCCFDCASRGEERVAMRSVGQHLAAGIKNFTTRKNGWGRYDFAWAWERLTKTGDYAQNGYFALSGIQTTTPKP